IIKGLLGNPNVVAALIVSLEQEDARGYVEALSPGGKPCQPLAVLAEGGTLAAEAKGIAWVRECLREAGAIRREKAALATLTIGLECGWSDATSGLASNPVLGLVADRLVAGGARVILTELSEAVGAGHILARRAANPEVRERIESLLAREEALTREKPGRDRGLIPANIAGGISTIQEKALGSIMKGGSTAIQEVLGYGEVPTKPGLVLMDAPGAGIESMTAMASAGAQLVLFSTGRGNPTGNPLAPTIKVTANPRTTQSLGANIDVDVSAIISGFASLEDGAKILWQELLATASGKPTRAELNGDVELAFALEYQ
ncbi:MAG: UxaA family hydrolase, partial [Chloroflexota bacterium]|nr:UxaA family hydrolase [Chloroflexota bacterium]